MAIEFNNRGGFVTALEKDVLRRRQVPDRQAQLNALPHLRRTLNAVPGAAPLQPPEPSVVPQRTDVAAPLAAGQVPARAVDAPNRVGNVAGMNYEDVVTNGMRSRKFMQNGQVVGSIEGKEGGILSPSANARDLRTGKPMEGTPSGAGGFGVADAGGLFNPYAGINAFDKLKTAFRDRAQADRASQEESASLRRNLVEQATAQPTGVANALATRGVRGFARSQLKTMAAGEAALANSQLEGEYGLRREAVQQEGEDRRAGARNAIDMGRLGIDTKRLGLDAQDKAAERALKNEESFRVKLDREYAPDDVPPGADEDLVNEITAENVRRQAEKKSVEAFAQRFGESGSNTRQVIDLYRTNKKLAEEALKNSGPLGGFFGLFLDPEKGGEAVDPETAMAEVDPVLDQLNDTSRDTFTFRGETFDKDDLTPEQRRYISFLKKLRDRAKRGDGSAG